MIFLYLIKNSFIIIIGFLFSYILLKINIYFNICSLNIHDFYLKFTDIEFANIIIFFIIYFIFYFISSLINYIFSTYTFSNYYSIVVAFIISSIHCFVLKENGVNINIESYIVLLSIQIFLSFFINYSTKYENNNKTLI